MKNSAVKFASINFKKLEANATLPAKFKRMLESLPLKKMVEGKSVALKMHLGSNMGYITIHPLFVKILVKALKNSGGDVFITDLYHRSRGPGCSQKGLYRGYCRL